MEFLPSGTEVRSYDLVDVVEGVPMESFSAKRFDGGGHVIGIASSHPSSTGGYSGVRFSYDIMGRQSGQTNPSEINDPKGVEVSNWTPTGDDAPVGWQWTRQSYDWKGRPTITNHADGRIRQVSYGGCGCAGKEVMTVTDEGGRVQKSYQDVFGRVEKNEALNPDGSVYQSAVSLYNARDQITFLREYKGAAVEASCPTNTCKETARTYDGHGRLFTLKRPEQARPIKYSYNPDDTINTVEDPRGVILTNSYDVRHLVEKMVYTVPNDPATGLPNASIPSAATVEFAYDEAGNRRLMKDGMGQVTYTHNTLSQLKSEKRFFTDLASTQSGGNYTIEYDYNLVGALKSIKDPFNRINYAYNEAGQLKTIKG
ncbi:MAG TPA: hypothetical protein VFQ06_01770, partial [Nitrospira sp.]|nr:hypothetical protein [Nitrospira sp.]